MSLGLSEGWYVKVGSDLGDHLLLLFVDKNHRGNLLKIKCLRPSTALLNHICWEIHGPSFT